MPNRRRRGLTLLELILALALASIVLVMISQAVHLHLSVFDAGRNQVEQPQVARAVLRYIAADLRNAVRPAKADASNTGEGMAAGNATGAGAATGSSSPSGTQSKSSSGSTGTQSAAKTNSASNSQNTNSNASGDATESAQTLDVARLFGTQFDLQIDISRPPRVDQYAPTSGTAGTSSPTDIVSDVKTVSYFLKAGDASGASGTVGTSNSTGGTGLYRREQDRAVTSYASKSNGGATGSSSGSGAGSGTDDGSGQLLAPEVNRLEFRYFDGSSWVPEWDSQEQAGLPLAVEITLGINPVLNASATTDPATSTSGLTASDTDEFTYRLVVRLPVAEKPEATDMSAEASFGDLEP